MPKTILGEWSVGLNALFLIAVVISIMLATVFNILSFDNRWWDVTVGVAFPISIIALITGIIAVKKYKERSILVSLSIFFGLCTVLFALLHSLFISD